jgi:thiamine-phosphate pyrophosphorylase
VDPLPAVRAALAAGADVIQVRRKGGTDRACYDVARATVAACREHGAQCIVDDRVDVALAVGADGVHLGATDLPVEVARRVLGPDALIGGTAREPASARRLVEAGADYLGVGPMRATATKEGLPAPLGVAGVAGVAAAVDVPVIAIGGVVLDDVVALRRAGVHGVAVTGAAARGLLRALATAGGSAEARSSGAAAGP